MVNACWKATRWSISEVVLLASISDLSSYVATNNRYDVYEGDHLKSAHVSDLEHAPE